MFTQKDSDICMCSAHTWSCLGSSQIWNVFAGGLFGLGQSVRVPFLRLSRVS